MTIIIKNLRDLEKVSIACTPSNVPQADALLTTLERIQPALAKKGWKVDICNRGTNTVCWIFKKSGTKRTVCRHVHVTPIAHLPFT